uniref:Putative ovule protein n=1 Tax=Solanum chacoense TaxID=4108 RepID=A0A0V0HB95_SOLCH
MILLFWLGLICLHLIALNRGRKSSLHHSALKIHSFFLSISPCLFRQKEFHHSPAYLSPTINQSAKIFIDKIPNFLFEIIYLDSTFSMVICSFEIKGLKRPISDII